MVDCTNTLEELNNYKVYEKKRTLKYKDKKYLVKFPSTIIEKTKISYINNAFLEYVESNIFKICNIELYTLITKSYKEI